MHNIVFRMLILGFLVLFTAALAADDCNNFAPDYERIVCRIVPRDGDCYHYAENGRQINQCNYDVPCRVWTGMELQISCGEEFGDTTLHESLYLVHGNSTLGRHEVDWSFASSELEGLYECRMSSENGSLFANRSIIVDRSVHVIPRDTRSYEQICRRDIVPDTMPGYNCSVARGTLRYAAGSGGRHTVRFNVLGVRPIHVMIDVVWVNHYPVDLHPSWNTQASNSTSQHSVELNSNDLVFVGDDNTVRIYLVITANDTIQSSTMCVSLQFHRAPSLFPGEGLVREVTAFEGQSADFDCSIRIDDERLDDGAIATVAFLVRASKSSDLFECFNCTFSSRELSHCREMRDQENCIGLQFINVSVGDPDMLTHYLTAHWGEVNMSLTGYEVVCAVGINGITQWAHSATLTVYSLNVTPTIPHVPLTATHHVTSTTTYTSTSHTFTNVDSNKSTPSLTVGVTVGVAIGVVVGVVILISLAALGLILLHRHRHGKKRRLPISDEEESTTLRPNEKT